MKDTTWGWHHALDCYACDRAAITSREQIAAFSKALVEKIDMVAYGAPVIEHFATHDAEKAGYSLVQLIETSNICGHFCDSTGDCYIDVFSCKPFNKEDVVAVINEFFNPKNITEHWIVRTAKP
jgi:S-adenosylmethionine/arginine decarboxylase-like enzyme